MSKSRRKKRPPKRVLALPDLEQSKAAVLNTLTSKSGQRSDRMWVDSSSTSDLRRFGARRVEEGRLTGTYWQPVVSLPRSSNRTCPFRASGFPTDFTN